MTRSIRRLFTLGRTLAIATLVLSPTIAVAQAPPGDYTDDTSLPGGRRGERIRQVLDAVSSGKPARIEALVKDAFGGRFREIPLEQHLRAQADFYDSSRGLDFYGVRRYAEPGPAEPGGGDREEPAHRRLAGSDPPSRFSPKWAVTLPATAGVRRTSLRRRVGGDAGGLPDAVAGTPAPAAGAGGEGGRRRDPQPEGHGAVAARADAFTRLARLPRRGPEQEPPPRPQAVKRQSPRFSSPPPAVGWRDPDRIESVWSR